METIQIRKGLDIAIDGAAKPELVQIVQPQIYAVLPADYYGFKPHVEVHVGDSVCIGTPLMTDKVHPELRVVSPVSGTVAEIARGERRKLLYISVQRDDKALCETFDTAAATNRESMRKLIFASGIGALLRQRPYDVVPNPEITPRDIFVSAFDTAPLAANPNFILHDALDHVQHGLSALSMLTDGKVYLSVAPDTETALRNMRDVEIVEFVGPHPAGTVGVQMNHIAPVNKGETVWSMNIQDVAMLGRFLQSGRLSFEKTIALVGPEMQQPAYIRTILGAQIGTLIKGRIAADGVRIINGNVLTGRKSNAKDFLGAFAGEITAIAEGDHADEMFGWIAPRLNMFSNSNLFLAKLLHRLCPQRKFHFDARILGGERAFIMSGEMEKVFPMDVMPEQLVKAMIARNIDKMEQLGACEVAPEDFALAEYVCSSKIEIQRIVREALNYMRKELE